MKGILPGILIIFLCHHADAQQTDSTNKIFHFSGSVSVTHNGLSFIPTFSLEKPAVIFILSMGRSKLRFEPEMRFALEGKPWSFLFWWRYQLVKTNKFGIRLGAHPAINFKTQEVILDGVTKKMIIARRYVAGELTPVYYVSKSISVGMYYLYSRALDFGTAKNTHFITLNSSFSNIRLAGSFYMRLVPQVYYLKMDQQDGFFMTSSVSLYKKHFPFSLSGIVNKRLQSNITGSRNFVWNTSLVYSFNQQ
jgi:hypothetical protein